ncbi:ribonuclease E inhibitor RraB [Phaeobacter sp. JH20_02]|uniref:ribonuclease E inhibitor RraB n=1 Tax=Phaeobacter TaxID=302485 RepID=UPI0030C985E1
MAHDFDTQKAETFSAFSDLQAEGDLPFEADLDLFFVAEEAKDWMPLAEALADLGFYTQWAEAEGDDPATLIATMPEQILSAAAIWMVEEVATRTALDHGFRPDGWGFAED